MTDVNDCIDIHTHIVPARFPAYVGKGRHAGLRHRRLLDVLDRRRWIVRRRRIVVARRRIQGREQHHAGNKVVAVMMVVVVAMMMMPRAGLGVRRAEPRHHQGSRANQHRLDHLPDDSSRARRET